MFFNNGTQQKGRSPTRLQQKFISRMKRKDSIRVHVDQQKDYTQAESARQDEEVMKNLRTKRLTVSNFDPKRNKAIYDRLHTFKDHLKLNCFSAIGKRQLLENVVKQNFKPLLEQEIPTLEKKTGFSRRDLYNLYSHFLSIFRIQQT